MKITLENQIDGITAIIEDKSADDATVEEVFDRLIIPALLGLGYQKGSIDKLLAQNI